MSSQKGNCKKGSQKFQNRTAFKNNLHDTSKRTKEINNLEHDGLCERCKEIIEWKVKYKKYKPLTVPKKCTKCEQRTVKKAYYIVCPACINKMKICGKCGIKQDELTQPSLSTPEQMSLDSQFQQELKMLPERKRRTFLRLQAKGKLTSEELEQKIDELTGDGSDFSFGDADEDIDSDEPV